MGQTDANWMDSIAAFNEGDVFHPDEDDTEYGMAIKMHPNEHGLHGEQNGHFEPQKK